MLPTLRRVLSLLCAVLLAGLFAHGPHPVARPIAAPVAAASSATSFICTLNGAKEVPPSSSQGTGTASVVLSADERSARITLNFSNLSSAQNAAHIHGPAASGTNAPPLISLPLGQINSFTWNITPTGDLSVAEQVAALKAGQLYINVHTANDPDGEIRGQLAYAGTVPSEGRLYLPVITRGISSTSPITPTDPITPTGPLSTADAIRFLEQATFGPTPAEVTRLKQIGLSAWLTQQRNATPSTYTATQLATIKPPFPHSARDVRWLEIALQGDDQLRQRVALALSQILVVSESLPGLRFNPNPATMVSYTNMLALGAFGNYGDLLYALSRNPEMGAYLDHANSAKADPAKGTQPAENYARELLQLFSIGTFALNLDGSVRLDATGKPIENYTQTDIEELSRALTGWQYANAQGAPTINYTPGAQLVPVAARHDTGAKTVLGTALPAGQGADADLRVVVALLKDHPSTAPFISRQLIQHLVTSNPSPEYIKRVATVFRDNRDQPDQLFRVVTAILLDPEARGDAKTAADYGKLREPLLYTVGIARLLELKGTPAVLLNPSREMGQNVFSASSVFNFYQPDNQIVFGTTSLFAPPAQLQTTDTIVRRVNFVYDVLFTTDAGRMTINLSPWEGAAANPAQLVDQLDELLLHDRLPTELRQKLIAALGEIPASNSKLRVQTALYVLLSSMQYQVQR
jgi:uncharacterized protein (DUF1800 family)